MQTWESQKQGYAQELVHQNVCNAGCVDMHKLASHNHETDVVITKFKLLQSQFPLMAGIKLLHLSNVANCLFATQSSLLSKARCVSFF
jgi:hypothetical protein